MRAGDSDQRLVVMLRHHLEFAIGQTLAAIRTLKTTRLPPKNIQDVHEFFLPETRRDKPAKLIASPRCKGLAAEPQLMPEQSLAGSSAHGDTRPACVSPACWSLQPW